MPVETLEEKRRREELERLRAASGQQPAPAAPQQPAPLGMQANALRQKEIQQSMMTPDASPEEIAAEEAAIRAQAQRQGAIDARETQWRGTGLLGTPGAMLFNKLGIGNVVTAEEHAAKLESQGLSKARAARLAKKREAAGLANTRAAQMIAQNQFGIEGEGRQEERTVNAEDRALQRQIDKEQRTIAEADKAREPVRYWDGDDPTRVRTFYTNGKDVFERSSKGEQKVFPDEQGLVPYRAIESTGRRSVKGEERDDDKLMRDVATTVFMNNFSAASGAPPEVGYSATGHFDPERVMGEYGLYGERSAKGNAIQDYQAAVRGLSFEGAAPLLEQLGVNPTDKDLEVSFKTAGDNRQNPYAFFSQFKRSVIPAIVGKARLAGVRSEAEISALEQELNKMADAAISKYGQGGDEVPSQTTVPGSTWNDDLENEYQELLRMRGS